MVTNDGEMAREFNNLFSNVFTVEDSTVEDVFSNALTVFTVLLPRQDIDCAEPEVEAKVKELKLDKAAGSDGFLPKVIKAVADGVVPHLCQIFGPRQRYP